MMIIICIFLTCFKSFNRYLDFQKYNNTNNIILKTINNNFEIKKDWHLIKNNNSNFIPQTEINFSENIKIYKNELQEIFEDENFSVIEINKGRTLFLNSLQFIFKKIIDNSVKGVEEDLSKIIKNKVSEFIEKVKNFSFCIFGKKEKKNIKKRKIQIVLKSLLKIFKIQKKN